MRNRLHQSWFNFINDSEAKTRIFFVAVVAPIVFFSSGFLDIESRYSFILSLLSAILGLLIVEVIQNSNSKGFSVLLGIATRDKEVNQLLLNLQDCLTMRGLDGHQFIDYEINRLISTTSSRLSQFPKSEVFILDKYREREATTRVIELAKKELRAISYFALNYWSNDPGGLYLKSQKQLIDRGIFISRIFIVPEKFEEEYLNEIEKHSRIGIECYVVVERVSNGATERDCIIVDDTAVSYAIDIDHSTGFRSAVISFSKAKLLNYEITWNQLKAISLEFASWKASLESASAAKPDN